MSAYFNRYPSTQDNPYFLYNPANVVNQWIVMVSVINWSSAWVYLYRDNSGILQRLVSTFGTLRGGRTAQNILIGVNHDNDACFNITGRAVTGLQSDVKYIFMWNEVFSQAKIEQFINEVLFDEF